MKKASFLEKTEELSAYSDRYETVTVFEITQHYGSSICAFLAFCLCLPLLVFSAQWAAVPLAFMLILLGTLLLFDQRLWLVDMFKSSHIPSSIVKTGASWVIASFERLKNLIPEAPFYAAYAALFGKINPLVLILAAFQVGFIQSPDTSNFTIFSLLFVSLGSATDDGYLCVAGYSLFLLGLI